MSAKTQVFDEWFDALSLDDQEEVISHILKNKSGTPMMEGIFSGTHGRVEGGVFSGPTGRTTKICPGCNRPL